MHVQRSNRTLVSVPGNNVLLRLLVLSRAFEGLNPALFTFITTCLSCSFTFTQRGHKQEQTHACTNAHTRTYTNRNNRHIYQNVLFEFFYYTNNSRDCSLLRSESEMSAFDSVVALFKSSTWSRISLSLFFKGSVPSRFLADIVKVSKKEMCLAGRNSSGKSPISSTMEHLQYFSK